MTGAHVGAECGAFSWRSWRRKLRHAGTLRPRRGLRPPLEGRDSRAGPHHHVTQAEQWILRSESQEIGFIF